MKIEARVTKRVGGLALDLAIDREGSLALFGPSGAGKSTALACIAGLVRPDQGRIVVNGEVLFDTARGVDRGAHQRGVAVAFQDHRLFPHLPVRDNLTFAPDADDGERLEVVCGALGLGPLMNRRPGDLSGGERSRVSLGRAMLSPAPLLLLDEPMAGLDAGLRTRAIGLLQLAMDRWEKTILYVSHSPAEVAALTGHVIAMDQGRVVAEGPPMNVLTSGPVLALWRDEGFENSFAGRVEAEGIRAGREIWRTERRDLVAGATIVVTLRASDVILARDRPEAISARNIFTARVSGVTGSSGVALVHLEIGGVPLVVEVTAAAARDLAIAAGAELWAIVKATSLRIGA